MTNFSDPADPAFIGTYATEAPPGVGTIRVVTWNIKFSREIEQAITELQTVPTLRDADILLLQEMDEEGVEAIARALAYNYVYYPASIHSRHNRNFGNAVLSRWPLSEGAKLLLPHANPKNGQRRIAVRATATIGSQSVVAYSVHTETLWLGRERREDQVQQLISVQADHDGPAVVGGDFNTLTSTAADSLQDVFDAAGFRSVAESAGPTFRSSGLAFTTDHLFARDLLPLEAGVWSRTEASDHAPLWAVLALERPKVDSDAEATWISASTP